MEMFSPGLAYCPHVENGQWKHFFQKRSPEWRFLKTRAYRFPWKDENNDVIHHTAHALEGMVSYLVNVFSPFHRFSVFVWTREDDSDTIRVDAYYFENGEKISVAKNFLSLS